VSVALTKLEGIQTVDVSLQKASALVTLKAGNKITVPQLRAVIRSSGYPTRDAQITARGKLANRQGTPIFDLLNGSELELQQTAPDNTADVVEVTGVSRQANKRVERLTISSMKR
jgi:hypothetical protein